MDGPVLALSPHLDDAVMSAGRALAARAAAGNPPVVCTVFAGEPAGPLSAVATAFHGDCGLGADAVAVRKAEDLRAVTAIGARPLHLDFLDALYRRHGDGWLCDHTDAHFDPAPRPEPALAAGLVARVRQLIGELRPAEV